MLERIQAFADDTGIIAPQAIEVFDASVFTDEITGETKRGDLRKVDLATELTAAQRADLQKGIDLINGVFAGPTKAQARTNAAKAKVAADRAAEAARVKAEQDAAKAEKSKG